jgi:Spy/CpxP family protein refolding chaperone
MSTLLTFLLRGSAKLARVGPLAAVVWALLLSAPCPARAQEEPPPDAGPQESAPARRRPRRDGLNLLARLNLTPEQFAQLREIRRQSDADARALGRRLRLARRALDEAIYADALDETVVEGRAREVAGAQAALVRLRAQTEMRVRRVLTPEQLQTFRQLRQRARRRLRDTGDAPAAPTRRRLRRRP